MVLGQGRSRPRASAKIAGTMYTHVPISSPGPSHRRNHPSQDDEYDPLDDDDDEKIKTLYVGLPFEDHSMYIPRKSPHLVQSVERRESDYLSAVLLLRRIRPHALREGSIGRYRRFLFHMMESMPYLPVNQ